MYVYSDLSLPTLKVGNWTSPTSTCQSFATMHMLIRDAGQKKRTGAVSGRGNLPAQSRGLASKSVLDLPLRGRYGI